jgi:hypothetical protein
VDNVVLRTLARSPTLPRGNVPINDGGGNGKCVTGR